MADKIEKNCFVISPIGDPNTPERSRADLLLNHMLKPIFKEFKLPPPIRVDESDKPGSITHDIVESIMEAPFCIVDVAGKNPNVFYELAIAHGLGKPTIILTDEYTKPPFDIKDLKYIKFKTGDYESGKEAEKKIKNQISMILNSKFKPKSPITEVFKFQNIKEQGDNGEILIEILGSIKSLSSNVENMDQKAEMDRAKITLEELWHNVKKTKELQKRRIPEGNQIDEYRLTVKGDPEIELVFVISNEGEVRYKVVEILEDLISHNNIHQDTEIELKNPTGMSVGYTAQLYIDLVKGSKENL